MKFVTPTDLCSGTFCDGQARKKSMCACNEKTGVREWGIRALVECIELSLEGTSHQKSSFLSVAFAKLATVGHRNLRPQDGMTFNWMTFMRDIYAMTLDDVYA